MGFLKNGLYAVMAFVALFLLCSMGNRPGLVTTKMKNETVPGLKSKVNSLGMTFIYIEPGSFIMGSQENESDRNNQEMVHHISLSKGFYIQTTEVTQGQWKAVMKDNPSYFKNCGDDCPVERVSWLDAQLFIKKLNKKERHNRYRLPTQAEWEYACRAGSTTAFAFGACLTTDQANYDGNNPLIGCVYGLFRKKTLSVASFLPNAWGLYDMHGSVWEWCEDMCHDNGIIEAGLFHDGAVNPISKKGENRVIKGGSWISDASYCRSACRDGYSQDYKSYNLGFRLCGS